MQRALARMKLGETAPATAVGAFEHRLIANARATRLEAVEPVAVHHGDRDFVGHVEDGNTELILKDNHLAGALSLRRMGRVAERRARLRERVLTCRQIVEVARDAHRELTGLLSVVHAAFGVLATRNLSTAAYRARKLGLGIGETVGLTAALSLAFGVPPLHGALLSSGFAIALLTGADLGGLLRERAERPRVTAALARAGEGVQPVVAQVAGPGGPRFLVAAWCSAVVVFVLAAVAVGAVRAQEAGGVLVAAALTVLTATLGIAAALSSYRHASAAADVVEHLERARRSVERRTRRAARARVLRRFDGLTARLEVDAAATAHEAEARAHLGRAANAYLRDANRGVYGHGWVDGQDGDEDGGDGVPAIRRVS